MTAEKKQPIWTGSFISISASHFIIFVVFYTLLTTLPMYVIKTLHGNAAQGALMVTVMLISAILLRPFSGRLLERFGKKKILILAAVLFSATMFLYLIFNSYGALLVLRFIHGISFAIATTATGAIAADVIPADRRGEGLGYFAMAMNIAMVSGPFLGLTLLQFISYNMLFLILSVITLIGIFLSTFVHVPERTGAPAVKKRKFSVHDLFEVKALPIAAISGLVGFAYAGIVSFISVYSNEIGLAKVSGYFFVVFAVVMLLSRPVTGKTFDIKGPNWIVIPSLVVYALGLLLLSRTETGSMLLISAGLTGLGYGSLLPSFQTMCVDLAEPHRSGHATSTFFTMYDTGIALGTYILGLLAGFLDFRMLYIVCMAIVLLVLFLFVVYQKVQKQKVASR